MTDLPPNLPPLLGDAEGRYRINLVGNSGAGKSTVGQALARMLDVPYISMDRIMWQPGWKETPPEEFRARLRHQLDQDPRGWVADGNYDRRGGRIAFDAATDVIWLDPPLALYLPRIIRRTLLRLLGLGEPCSPGCSERFSEVFFSKDSIIWWCISHHRTIRKRLQERMVDYGLINGRIVNQRKMRRIGGWGRDLKNWLKAVEAMSTAGIALARILGVPYIDMDKIMYQPGWVETPPDEFQARLREVMAQNSERGWVIDGNYVNTGGKIAFDASTDVICLVTLPFSPYNLS
ncbi:hypothetical protein CVT26_012501 [Gymnopilus dilepis]|uniref:Adenylate kinase n=1 Tax=Gymnopilus dilepis TaxID=231916 RepID=A0A409YWA7_9AGAR|nr:hypothetical protein CVT26_012501 [Gymnopilus dilepis]